MTTTLVPAHLLFDDTIYLFIEYIYAYNRTSPCVLPP